ncbi:MAG: bifunctional glycosyltransferase family 2/GtrA family protein [Endomicrobiales bacterium]|nr:bifunctional glycosyltransferase family 2/GtrA family protein [Endomicrobiales bacterium]
MNEPKTNGIENVVFVIPAYKPGAALNEIVRRLRQLCASKIVIVDDGSPQCAASFINDIEKGKEAVVLHHKENLGKGEALKTAFRYILNTYTASRGVVTLDADGQHTPEDAVKMAYTLENGQESLFLGVRQFNQNIPFRSKIGNEITKIIFWLITSKKVSDTQTGLRGIPKSMLNDLVAIKSSGYDYEMDMLIYACKRKVILTEVNIETKYENNNASSHFNPLLDSLKIYYVLFRFLISSFAASIIDTIMFVLFQYIIGNILISIICSRLISATINFRMTKSYVFYSKGNIYKEVAKYSLLAITLMLVSYESIKYLSNTLQVNIYMAKIFTETMLFVFSFAIQKIYIFRKK